MDRNPSVQSDPHLIAAGQCFMFLSWVQSVMCDFLALEALDPESRARYNAAFTAGAPWPEDFSVGRLTLMRNSFSRLKQWFLAKWPQSSDVRASIERVVLLRHAFAHAQIQPFRPYLLYVPDDDRKWGALGRYFRCAQCLLPLKECNCAHASIEALSLRCQEPWFEDSLYGDIGRVDVECFVSTAKLLGVEYQGGAWRTGNGSWRVARSVATSGLVFPGAAC